MKKDMDESRQNLIELLHKQFRELSSRTVLFHHWISELLGLNTIDHKCLDIIVKSDSPLTGAQLANITGLSSGAITGVIDRLEKRGYVIRDRDLKDRRLVYVKPIMSRIEKEVFPVFNSLHEIMTKVYSNYSNNELESMLDATTKINQIMNERTKEIMEKISQRKTTKKWVGTLE
ncbi:MAG TPA: MarR family transcriptional regulator [Candidatus Nitrosocosmicus sp.]|jgi:DNA-binding MarR family transcriptional regulator|nr:MarR family transcriptional regulator [Candidatus Nitrosocosmicus sp.]